MPGVAGKPKDLETALVTVMPVDAEGMPVGTLLEKMQGQMGINLVVNWNALAAAGVTKETPVTLHVREMQFEQVLRTLMEVLPVKGTRANYSVDENTVEITTNAELGKENVSKFYDLGRALSYSFNTPVTHEDQERNILILAAVLRAELVRAGEPLEVKGHGLDVKDGKLLATVSERGQGVINRMVNLFNQPLKVGQLASGTQLTSAAKKAQDAMAALQVTPVALARNPEKYAPLNVVLLPGVTEELAKAATPPDLMAAVNDGGAILVGPSEVIRGRTSLAVYDMRDVIKKVGAKSKMTPPPSPADVQKAIVQVLRTTIKPEGQEWAGGEDLEKKPAVMVPYNGLLVVFATAATQRMVAAGLQDMNK